MLHIVPHLPALWLRQAGESGSGSSVIGGSGSLLENIHIVNLSESERAQAGEWQAEGEPGSPLSKEPDAGLDPSHGIMN